jgi:hypothetical protein
MGLIKLNKYELPDKKRAKGYTNIQLKSNSIIGHVPLLKFFNIYTNGSTDYFNLQNGSHYYTSVARQMDFNATSKSYGFNQNMKRRLGQYNIISISMLSVLGMQGRPNMLMSKLKRSRSHINRSQHVLVTNPVDVFILAMIKPTDIGKVEEDTYCIKFDSSIVTLLISEEKYINKKFLNENYNKTVAKHLRYAVDDLVKKHDIRTEIVPDDILEQYYKSPYSVESNSVFELIEIDKQVKEKVLSTINKKILIW